MRIIRKVWTPILGIFLFSFLLLIPPTAIVVSGGNPRDMDSALRNSLSLQFDEGDFSSKAGLQSSPTSFNRQGGTWVSLISGYNPGTPAEALAKTSDTTQLCVDTNFYGYWRRSVVLNGSSYFELDMPGAGHAAMIGQPAVPMLTRFFEIPQGIDITLEVLYTEAQTLYRYDIVPVQTPVVALPGETPLPFVINQTTYQTDAFFPYMNASIAGGEASSPIILRGHRLAAVSFYPIQFNPERREVKVYSKIEVALKYSHPAQVDEVPSRLRSSAFEALYESFIVNYLPRPTFTTFAAGNMASPTKSNGGGPEYLIITHPDFLLQARQLANWKQTKGVPTQVVTTTQIAAGGPTADDIIDYIQNAYDSWNPAPSYVLLVGDVEFIPTFYGGMVHPAPHHDGAHIPTDNFYFTVDGDDYFADIFSGRISVDTAAEATTIINKILDYERNPPVGAGFYTSIAGASFFEDGSWPFGTEDFPFVNPTENIRNFLLGQGYTIDQIYWADNPATPATMYDGTPLPWGLLPAQYAWNADAGNVTLAINSSRFLAYHIDHGDSANFWNHLTNTWGGYDGWHRPRFVTQNFTLLANGDEQPVVLSFDCNVGWFDSETDQTDDANLTRNIESFAEQITRLQNAGAVAAIASTRLSYIFSNDILMEGIIDAIWPGYDPAFASGGLFSLGQVLMYGKVYVGAEWGYNAHITAMGTPVHFTNTTFHLYHLFGDPEMSIWTDVPESLNVSYPDTIGSGGLQQFVINVTDGAGAPLHFAKVCLQKSGDVYEVEYTNPAGLAFFAITPGSSGEMNVTVTLHNYLPHEGSLMVTGSGATVSVSPVASSVGGLVTITGSSFSGTEIVDIYFGGSTPDTTATAAAGSFTKANYAVPAGSFGYLNLIAVGQTSGRTAVTLFRRLPPLPPTDPYTYSQWDSATWYLAADGQKHWDSPSIQLIDPGGNPVASNDLAAGTTYTVEATIYNDAVDDAADTVVTFQWASWGSGQVTWNLFDTDTILVPGGGSAPATGTWTPSVTGHTCLMVEVSHGQDEDLGNNKGQENTHVKPVASPADVTLDLGNPTDNTGLIYLIARQTSAGDIWPLRIDRAFPQVQEPGATKTVNITLNAPADAVIGETRVFSISAYLQGELLGGVQITFEIRRPTPPDIFVIIIIAVVVITLVAVVAIIGLRRRKLG